MQNHSHITPKYLNPPKQGKKMASVKDENDDLYWLPPDFLSWLQKGEAADITWNAQKWGSMDARVVTAINGRDITGAAQPGPQDRPAPSPAHAPTRSTSDSEKSLEMFCMGVVGRIGGAGVIQQPQEIPLWLQAAKDAWETIIQGKAPRMVDTPTPGAKYASSEPPAPSEGDYYGH